MRRQPVAGGNTENGGDDNGSSSHRRTAQEAWVKAIQMLGLGAGEDVNSDGQDNAVRSLLKNLATTANPNCVPRKLEKFVKYCHRNSSRLLPGFDGTAENGGSNEDSCRHTQKKQKIDSVQSSMRAIAESAYCTIRQKQRPLLNLPTPTSDRESAMGQLRLLGFGEHDHLISETDAKYKLHVVHRLDCETSGIMVVARNQPTSSFLSRAWRERDSVKKVYLAHVIHWPPYHDRQETEGIVDIPLAASRKERIKWEVRSLSDGGKECETYWSVCKDLDKTTPNTSDETKVKKKGITLELHPITGRTHQLRLHCATIGSGIVGDSLYGDNPIPWSPGDSATHKQPQDIDAKSTSENDDTQPTLRLHAHKLTLPNPTGGKNFEFESPKPW